MYRSIRTGQFKSWPDAMAVAFFTGTGRLPSGYVKLDTQCDGALSEAIKRPELSLARGRVTCLYPQRGAARLYLLGLGDREQFNHGQGLRAAAASLVKASDRAGVRRLGLHLGPGLNDALGPEDAGRAVGDGLAIGAFNFDELKGTATKKEKSAPDRGGRPSRLEVKIDRAMQRGLQHALRTGESVNLARSLAATPPNIANPAYLVSFCRRMARSAGLRCTIINAARARQLKMNGLLAVGAAGSTPPALICLEHRPRAAASQKPIMLVGKAITFDTGGYSIKPAASMDAMKYDKCGGMAVIGAMHAVASLKLPRRVVALIPTAENMIDAKGYRPSDILTMSNGVTVEVTNTDAEGRLVLADALAYGCKTYKPRAIIDMATLTGGVVVALGSACAGVFCQDQKLRTRLLDAAEHTGERLWHLPMWQEHKALLQSVHADITNSGGREAHASQGAAFLSHFVDEKTPWAHLDIAGVSDVKKDGELYARGPTGFGVRLAARAIEKWR